MDDELAAFDAELKALEAAPAAPAAPRVAPAAPTVISSKPMLGKAAPVSDARNKPVSEWASPDQIRRELGMMGLPVPNPLQTAPPAHELANSQRYIPAPHFTGPRPGYVFKTGMQGTGYYLEEAALGARHHAPAVPQPQGSLVPLPPPPSAGHAGGASSSGAPAERNISRTVAGQVWQDKTLLEWPEDDFRVFVGDLGNEVNDELLSNAFKKYPSFQMARVVRDRNSTKTKGAQHAARNACAPLCIACRAPHIFIFCLELFSFPAPCVAHLRLTPAL